MKIPPVDIEGVPVTIGAFGGAASARSDLHPHLPCNLLERPAALLLRAYAAREIGNRALVIDGVEAQAVARPRKRSPASCPNGFHRGAGRTKRCWVRLGYDRYRRCRSACPKTMRFDTLLCS